MKNTGFQGTFFSNGPKMSHASYLAPNRLIPYPNEKDIMKRYGERHLYINRLRQLRVRISSKWF